MSRFFFKIGRSFALLALLACLSVGLCVPAQAQTKTAKSYVFQVLHTFTDGADGAYPVAGLIMDSSGVLYGTAGLGGLYGSGTIFKYALATNTFITLYSFTALNSASRNFDGVLPGANLIRDIQGNLYGTAEYGGVYGFGTVFMYISVTNTFITLYNFTNSADGAYPEASLIMDGSGALYGTTEYGDTHEDGTICKLAPATYAFTALYSFTDGADGANPTASLIMDSSGAFYGTANDGGANGYGTIFKYVPIANTFTTLYSFTNGNDGAYPAASLIMDSSGNLYGTTQDGGVNGYGVVFKYASATHTFTTLYSFTGGSDGAHPPRASLIMDSDGNLYGTTQDGGVNGYGVVFKYTFATNTLTTLHSFTGGADGANPPASLIMDDIGNIYGTTFKGGDRIDGEMTSGFGTIFVLRPIYTAVPLPGLHPSQGPVSSVPHGGTSQAP